jgi:DUF4097 and DUF4098 domain-containing protein YvlB
MSKTLLKSLFTIALLTLLMAVPAAGASINKSITIEAGSESDGASSVNGSVTVEKGAVVSGDVSTVNGKVRVHDDAKVGSASTVNGGLTVGDNVTAGSLETVNGSISVGEGSEINGFVEAVNGRIALDSGAKVDGNVGNVNGDIRLAGAEVDGDLQTVSGNIYVQDAAVVTGDIRIEKPSVWSFGSKKDTPEVVIGPGSVVKGKIMLERKVELYISESAEVGGVEGAMSMDDAVRFSGDTP